MSPNLTKLIDIFDTLERNPGIKLNCLDKNLNLTSPADFLYHFFTEYNDQYNTIKNNKIVTGTGHYRSVNEIYDLTLSYFPDYQLIDYFRDIYLVAAEMWNDCDCKKALLILFCPQIQRNVLSSITKQYNNIYFKSDSPYYTDNNKYFPFYFKWIDPSYYSEFWEIFYKEETTFELIGDRFFLGKVKF